MEHCRLRPYIPAAYGKVVVGEMERNAITTDGMARAIRVRAGAAFFVLRRIGAFSAFGHGDFSFRIFDLPVIFLSVVYIRNVGEIKDFL